MITEKTYKKLIKLSGVAGMITLALGGWTQNLALIITGVISSSIYTILQIF